MRGHQLSTRHGAYVAPLRLGGEIEEIAELLRSTMPHYSPVFAAAVQAAAIAGARLERACEALKTAAPGDLTRLESDARGWHRSYVGALNALGLTPLSASKMGLNLALAGGSVRAGLANLYRAETEDAEGGER